MVDIRTGGIWVAEHWVAEHGALDLSGAGAMTAGLTRKGRGRGRDQEWEEVVRWVRGIRMEGGGGCCRGWGWGGGENRNERGRLGLWMWISVGKQFACFAHIVGFV